MATAKTLMWWRCIALLLVVVLLIALLLPFGYNAVWDGHFLLTIKIVADHPIDAKDLYFTTCWSDEEAEYAMKIGTVGDVQFRNGEQVGDNRYTITVPCSGRMGPYGSEHSYHEPVFLVCQCKMSNTEDGVPVRKRVAIPAGRGPRSLTVNFP